MFNTRSAIPERRRRRARTLTADRRSRLRWNAMPPEGGIRRLKRTMFDVHICVDHEVTGSARRCASVGSRSPVRLGRPLVPDRRGGAGTNRRASSRSRVTTQTWARTASSRSIAEKPLSATATMRRSGNHRATCNNICRAPSTSDLWRRPRRSAQRCDGISTVRNGSPSAGLPRASHAEPCRPAPPRPALPRVLVPAASPTASATRLP